MLSRSPRFSGRPLAVTVSLLTVAAALVTALPATPASAQTFWDTYFKAQPYRRPSSPVTRFQRPRSRIAVAPRRPRPAAVPAATTIAAVAPAATAAANAAAAPVTVKAAKGSPALPPAPRPEPPLLAVVSIEDQTITVHSRDGTIERSRISSGKRGHPTPTGIFGITQKNRWHESNLYSGAEMPFMQRLTWSGIALHEGPLPGYPASHGCIRLPRAFAANLFAVTRTGFRVIVAPDDVSPRPVAHAALPQPLYRSAPGRSAPPKPVQTAGLGDAPVGSAATPTLDPIAYAAAERDAARAELRAADAAVKAAESVVSAAQTWHKAELAKLALAERRLETAARRLEDVGLLGRTALRNEVGRGAELSRAMPVMLSEYDVAERELDAARVPEATAKTELRSAEVALDAAEAVVEGIKARIAEMGRRLETVSVLVSRKDRRVYVRQALRAVFDAPVTIRDPDEAIGNHVFVAAPPAPGATTLSWMTASLPLEDRPVRRAKSSGGRAPGSGEPPSVAEAVRMETPESALDRIEMADDVKARIAELVWTGASLVISDHGRGHDGAVGHDFSIETRH